MNNIERAINNLREGRFVIIRDSEIEEEADLTIAAKHVDEKKMIFLLKYTCGQVCVPMNKTDINKIGLRKMINNGHSKEGRICNFTIPVDSTDAKTGISAYDKYLTIRDLISNKKRKLKSPGHTFPLIANEEGVLKRSGHTEASLDLVKLSKIKPEAAVICELMNRRTGKPMYKKDLEEFSKRYNIPIVDIKDLIEHRRKNE